MTEFDKTLIAKAGNFRRYAWRDISVLIMLADTKEARERLADIRQELHQLATETL